jgi:hypothetical protein
MTSWRRPLRSAVILLVLVGCKARSIAGGEGSKPGEGGLAEAAVDQGADSAAAAGPRCTTERALSLGLEGDVEFGGVARHGGGIALGLVHQARGGSGGAVALLPADASGVRVVELGPAPPDAPPPIVSGRGPDTDDLLAIAPTGGREGGRAMQLYRIAGDGTVESKAPVVPVRDDWPSVDVAASSATAVVAWDAVANELPPRGVIRVTTLEASSFRPGPARDVSPPGEDAEDPRVLRTGSGFAVVWAARRPEFDGAQVREPRGESGAPEEERTGRWIEVAALDQGGLPVGPVTRLTSTSARLSGFDAATLERPGEKSIVVVARFERGGGQGASLRLLRIRPDGSAEADQAIAATDGIGPGSPSLLVGPHGWASWMGVREQTVVLPLDEIGNPVGPPTDEDAFDAAQPLLTLGTTQMLAATLPTTSKGARLGVFSCRR